MSTSPPPDPMASLLITWRGELGHATLDGAPPVGGVGSLRYKGTLCLWVGPPLPYALAAYTATCTRPTRPWLAPPHARAPAGVGRSRQGGGMGRRCLHGSCRWMERSSVTTSMDVVGVEDGPPPPPWISPWWGGTCRSWGWATAASMDLAVDGGEATEGGREVSGVGRASPWLRRAPSRHCRGGGVALKGRCSVARLCPAAAISLC